MNTVNKRSPDHRRQRQHGLRTSGKPFSKSLHYLQSEDGSYTIESVIWFPMYMFITALIINVSMVFFTESQLLRVVQDGNRSFSVGRVTTRSAVEQYITERLAYLEANPDVSSQLVYGIIYTDLRIPVTALMPFTVLDTFFETTTILVSAQQIVEF